MTTRKTNAALLKDAYKTDHRRFYPKGTTFVSSNMTARSAKYATVPEKYHGNKMVFFGLSYFIQEFVIDFWRDNFFSRDEDEACADYESFMLRYLGPNDIGSDHIRALHRHGHLPIRIKALPEGTRVPMQVPMLIIENTIEEFFWVTNFLETLLSCSLWKPSVNATTAFAFGTLLREWCEKTGGDASFLPFQAHDFSFRGMSGLEDACVSGMAHLTTSFGSDTLPAAEYADIYYDAYGTCEITASSIAATEHAVSCLSIVDIEEQFKESGSYDGYALKEYGEYSDIKEVAEYLMMKRYLTELYPSGMISIVGDSFDYFRTLTDILPKLKGDILARDGKYVSRPDSGIPLQIICGDDITDLTNKCKDVSEVESWAVDELIDIACDTQEHGEAGESEVSKLFKYGETYYRVTIEPFWNRHDKTYYYFDGVERQKIEEVTPSPEELGALNILWSIFGGTVNDEGYKMLNPKVGLIYGDSINFDSCEAICKRLEKMGYASTNVCYGIGSWTYNGPITRDSFGIAVKATFGIVNGKPRAIFKDPKTGSGKKSAKGLLAVLRDEHGELYLRQEVPYDEYVKGVEGDQMEVIFEDGEHLVKPSLKEIRERLWG